MTQGSAIDPTSDDFDFRTWSLGNGKVKDKRAKLENLLGQLIEKKNSKLKKDLDSYCRTIKRKRNRAPINKDDGEEMDEGHSNMITAMHTGGVEGVNEDPEF